MNHHMRLGEDSPQKATARPPDPPSQRSHSMPYGAELRRDGSVRFRLWAPAHRNVQVQIDGNKATIALEPSGDGWHELTTAAAAAGSRYRFILSDGLPIADPASRFQPADVHGPSEVIDPGAYEWRDIDWRGRPWASAVLYELHLGAFTREGTFAAAIGKLDHLVRLGVTGIEVMPVAEFPGAWNWGYDGVLLFAPDCTYGRPEDFKAFIDAAHERGLMVLLDVVYNHFGPDGNFLPACAPALFTERHHTPWGAAINYDGADSAPVREFMIHNALYWIEEFHLDGLRLDAVHAIVDDGPKHILAELAERVRASAPDREIHLLLENEENQASRLRRDDSGRPVLFTAQWNDDVHHVLHTAATRERSGYYEDYAGDTHKLGRALAEGFAFQGEMMAFRGGPRGERSADLPPLAFVAFLQNHDQVGNRAFGERIGALAQDEAVRAISAVYLLLPQVPMLFMGEEWNAREPFQYFCDFAGELADSVRNGRREEFAKFPEFADPAKRDRIPDPQSRRTFGAAKLAWADCERPGHAEWLNRYRRLLQIRHREIVPLLAGIRSGGSFEIFGPGAVAVRWKIDGGELTLAANLSATPAQLPAPSGRELWREGAIGDGGRCGPWTVRWAIDRTGDSPKPEPIDEHALDELAARCGIHREGSNAHGAMRRVSVQTLQRLLQGLGVPAADTGQIRSSLESLERESWQRAIGPVQVVYEQAPADLDVRLPRGTAGVQWRITLEDGSERTGSAAFHELELTATREIDGREYECRRVRLDPAPAGYHRLTIEPDGSTMSLIATPGRCWLPANADAAAQRPRLWGIAAQLYLVRSERNWGIGDFADLGELVRIVRERGGDVVGVNPLHALFADNPEHASPYSPASRLLLNVLNIAVPSMPEFGDSAAAQALVAAPDFQAAIEECREAKLVDYRRVADLKTRVLTVLFAEAPASEARWREFEQFRGSRDESFERHCVFLALRQHFARRNAEQADWRRWPEAFRDRRAAAVAEFTANHGEEITYVAWLQWIADRQLAAAAAQARGMRIGLYCDLAVGADPSGAETWSEPDLVAAGLHVGAPPDPMSEHGQDWGLPPINPHRLRARAYRPFIELLRANMRHAGALRIDHVMALQRLHCIPQGMAPTDGAYVDYPLEDLVGILALESHRHGCMIVGEDLGTVPSGFRARMAEANVLSYRVLFFERDASQSFLPPERYPQLALAVVGNHDLPTLRGWWEGRDIALREQLEQCGPQQIESQRRERERDQQALLAALRDTGVWPQAAVPSLAELATATHQLIARTPAKVAIAQLDDVGLEAEPVNVPSARDYPHWRRRLATSIEELAAHDRFRAIAEAFNAERGSA